MTEFPNFKARNLDVDLGSGHTAYRHASLVDLYLHVKFYWNRRNVLWTDGPMDVRTYGRTFETHCIRSTQRSRPKNNNKNRLVVVVLMSTLCRLLTVVASHSESRSLTSLTPTPSALQLLLMMMMMMSLVTMVLILKMPLMMVIPSYVIYVILLYLEYQRNRK